MKDCVGDLKDIGFLNLMFSILTSFSENPFALRTFSDFSGSLLIHSDQTNDMYTVSWKIQKRCKLHSLLFQGSYE